MRILTKLFFLLIILHLIYFVPLTIPIQATTDENNLKERFQQNDLQVKNNVLAISGTPQKLSGSIKNNEVVLSWNPPFSDGGSAMSNYNI